MAHPSAGAGAGAVLGTAGGALEWSARPEVLIPAVAVAAAYALGWARLARRDPRAVSARRLVCAVAAPAAVAVALTSPLDALAHASLSAHMVQHALLVAVAAPLWLLADPVPLLLWALPAPVRRAVAGLVRPGTAARRLGAALAVPAVAWLAHAAALWAWHLPLAYDAALGDRLLHDLEHAVFFGTAVLFWWPVIAPAPRWRRPPGPAGRVTHLVLGAFQGSLLALLVALSPDVLYTTYARTSPALGLDPHADQVTAGLIMWAALGILDMLAILLLLARALAPNTAPATESQGAQGRPDHLHASE